MDPLRLLYRAIITDNTSIGLFLVVLLVVLAVIAAALARSHYNRYRGPETRYLNQIKTQLRSVLAQSIQEPDRGVPSSPKAGSNAPKATAPASLPKQISPLVSADELASAVPPQSLIGDRLRIIALMRKSQTKVNVAALQQISRAREASRTSLRFPGMAVNLAMMIGLLGTFIGIAIVIQQIGVNLNLGEEGLQSFGNVFSGMYTKFSTTLVALACAIVVSSLNFRLAQAQECLFEDLDRFTVSELLPATVPALEDETLLERVSQQLEKSFTLLEELARKNAKTAEQVGAIQTGFVDIVAGIRKQMQTESSERLQNLLGHAAGLMQQMSRVSDSLQTLASTLPPALSDSNQRLEKTLTSQFLPAMAQHKSSHTGWLLGFGAVLLGLLVAILVKLG